MNSKIIKAKKISAMFLAIVLIAGTIAALSSSISSSFMVGVEAQTYYDGGDDRGIDNRHDSYGQMEYSSEDTDKNSYEPTTITEDYGMNDNKYPNTYGKDNDNNYDKSQYQSSSSTSDYYKPQYPSYEGKDDRDKSKDSSSKSISINKLKCINTNLNINGNNAGNVSIGNKGQVSDAEEGYLGAYSSGNSGYDSGEGYSKQDKGFECIINNSNNNNNVTGNETIPPEPPKATLNVTKLVACNYFVGNNDPCPQLRTQITEDQFDIEVTNDNPVPSQFPGSESGTIVTLGLGNYIVSETIDDSVDTDLNNLRMQFPGYTITGPQVLFDGDCTDVNPNNIESTEATGTIGEGESQTCNIINAFQATQSNG